jgi:hypothetical protein
MCDYMEISSLFKLLLLVRTKRRACFLNVPKRAQVGDIKRRASLLNKLNSWQYSIKHAGVSFMFIMFDKEASKKRIF